MTQVKYLDKTGLGTVWTKVKGIVTPKADKVSSATNGHLAGLNASGNLTDSGVVASNVALKDGSYSQMTVGTAEDLASTASVASEFTYQPTGGPTSVGKGGTEFLDRVKGRTVVWNQLIKNAYIHFTYDNSAGTSTAGGDMFSGAAGGFDIVKGHKYAIIWRDTNSSIRLRNVAEDFQSNYMGSSIWTAPTTTTDGLTYVRYSVIAGAIVDTYINITDLTLMFGAGNEPSTVAEFEALYPLPYYEYNAGELINNAADGLKTVGFNLWDEEWETGNISSSTGQNGTSTTLIRSKNSIKKIPGVTQYYLKNGINLFFRWYDSDWNYMPFTTSYTDSSHRNEVFTWMEGAAYLRILWTATTYDNDVCVSVSNSERNGTYEPHWEETAALNLGDFKVKSPNIWDEEWEGGAMDGNTGADTVNADWSRSSDYIQISPSTSYYYFVHSVDSSNRYYVFYYTADKQYISNSGGQSASGALISPENAGYMRIQYKRAIASVSQYQVSICESGHGHDGKYYPYGALTIQGGLKQVFTAYDEISGGKFIRRVGSVTLDGTTEVVAGAYTPDGSSVTRFGYAGAQNTSIYSAKTAYLSDKFMYAVGSSGSAYAVTNTNTTGANRLFIWLPSSVASTDTAANSWLASNPSTFYYALATPEDFDLLTPIDTAIRNDPYGTEERIPADTAGTVLAPFRADITYSTNIKEAVEHLDENFISVASMTDFLTALNEQMNGTWSMIFKDGKYHFSFTANPEEQQTL